MTHQKSTRYFVYDAEPVAVWKDRYFKNYELRLILDKLYIYKRVLFGSNKTKSRLNNYSKEKIK